MTQHERNIFQLRNAKAQGRKVRFSYNTRECKNTPRVGLVDNVTDTHAVILDDFHNGAPRSCVLDRIISVVELAD